MILNIRYNTYSKIYSDAFCVTVTSAQTCKELYQIRSISPTSKLVEYQKRQRSATIEISLVTILHFLPKFRIFSFIFWPSDYEHSLSPFASAKSRAGRCQHTTPAQVAVPQHRSMLRIGFVRVGWKLLALRSHESCTTLLLLPKRRQEASDAYFMSVEVPSKRSGLVRFDVLAMINLKSPCVLYVGQAFRYSPENAFYIFNQQMYFIFWYLLDRASLI